MNFQLLTHPFTGEEDRDGKDRSGLDLMVANYNSEVFSPSLPPSFFPSLAQNLAQKYDPPPFHSHSFTTANSTQNVAQIRPHPPLTSIITFTIISPFAMVWPTPIATTSKLAIL
jgi:hypothetical protein